MFFLHLVEYCFFVFFAVNAVYLFVYAVASHGSRREIPATDGTLRRIAILIPAYKEDAVIEECVQSCMEQIYPRDKYDIIVISDHMHPETDQALALLPILLVNVSFQNSTKAKALNFAMAQVGDSYDLGLILDADNTIEKNFLMKINTAFRQEDVHIVQTHRTAKNQNTRLAVLDAVSEEINNNIFRQGHVNLGLSAALIGSGMAFDYRLLKKELACIHAVGGFDRALELTLLKAGYRIDYLPDAWVWDEKVQYHEDFSRQRRRWISAQLHYLGEYICDIPKAVRAKNWDFCDKVFQQMSLPRVMLLGFTLIAAGVLSVVHFAWAVKWWLLLLLVVVTLLIAIPRALYNKKLLKALLILPYSFVLMSLNIFKLKGANKKFIHTAHGVKK